MGLPSYRAIFAAAGSVTLRLKRFGILTLTLPIMRAQQELAILPYATFKRGGYM